MNLFVDTCNSKICLILEKDNCIIDSYFENDLLKVSDIFSKAAKSFLEKNKLNLIDIKNFYVIKGPGSYTGVRVGLTFVKTIMAINPNIGVYELSSLHFLAGLEKAITVIDAKSNQSYVGVYENGINIIDDQIIPNDIFEPFFENFSHFNWVYDYNLNIAQKNFINLKKFFIKVVNINEFNPLYIKGFI